MAPHSFKWWVVAAASLVLHLAALTAVSAAWPAASARPAAFSLELVKLPPPAVAGGQARVTSAPSQALRRAPARLTSRRQPPAALPGKRAAARQSRPTPPGPVATPAPTLAPVTSAAELSDRQSDEALRSASRPASAPGPAATPAPQIPLWATSEGATAQRAAAPPAPLPPAAPPSPSQRDTVSHPPRPAVTPRPPYPPAARRRLDEGLVVVRAWVDAAGRVARAALHHSSGSPDLDQSALNTIQTWRFVPGKREGKVTGYWVKVPIRFQLHTQLF